MAGVLAVIMLRGLGHFRVGIWVAMDIGALVVLGSGAISLAEALASIDYDVLLFLFGMFAIGSALEVSGYLGRLTVRLLSGAPTAKGLVLRVLLYIGLLSAVLMNDTLAVIGAPALVRLARKNGLDERPLLLALAFAITIGSVMSPIGNPQNLIVASGGGMKEPFGTFLRYFLAPTLANLLVAYFILKAFYGRSLEKPLRWEGDDEAEDKRLAFLCRISLMLVVLLSCARALSTYVIGEGGFRLSYIALISAAPILLMSNRRLEVLRRVDWRTLAFFVGMFVLMRGVWLTGAFQSAMNLMGFDLASPLHVMAASVLLSQLISNVPLTLLLLPQVLQRGDERALLALAAGSTIAGNATLLGAASNIIIVQGAEMRGSRLTFWEFAKVGIPLTLANVLVMLPFLQLA